MRTFEATETERLLPYPSLIATLSEVLAEYDRGEIVSPERLVVPCGDGRGVLLSMPSHARDLVAHKLITVFGANPGHGRPAIQGHVTCFDAQYGTPLFSLDGPTVTARRTAAVTVIGIQRLRPRPPRTVLIIGVGAQAAAHVDAILETLPETTLAIQGRSAEAVAAFCARWSAVPGRVGPARPGQDDVHEVVVAVTSSTTPVYDERPDPNRLVIGVGAYRLDMVEIGARTIQDSQLYVDDIIGAPVEAGDVVAAGADWATVKTLATALTTPPDFGRPVFLKSVGCAAWDLGACRVVRAALAAR